jgi:hypothetical protein
MKSADLPARVDHAAQEHAELDEEFAAMTQDEDNLAESTRLDAELPGASTEALHLAEARA